MPSGGVPRLRPRRTLANTTIRKDLPSQQISGTVPDAQCLDGQHLDMVMNQDANSLPYGQVGMTTVSQDEMGNTLFNGSWADPMSHYDSYFDYTTFARPWNYNLDQTTDTSDWFSSQFYAALRETDLAYSPPNQAWTAASYDPLNIDTLGIMDQNHAPLLPNISLGEGINSLQSDPGLMQSSRSTTQSIERNQCQLGRTSRVASPPNESSHEDRLPFAWNPRSRQIARAKPITLSKDDPIFATIDPTVAISETALSRLRSFLQPATSHPDKETFTLPDLSLVNVFISLFFGRFLPQIPVLHRPTLHVEALPSALLAIIMVIGSCYSRLRHTRRFGIVVLDHIRQNLLAMIEDDNSLMREPLTIYAAALVCYMDLWCGNKRAFELSEALRAVVVTYIRRLPNVHPHEEQTLYQGQQNFNYENNSSTPGLERLDSVQSQWVDWGRQESNKRLRWFVYMIDSQFPAILGMSGMMTTADIRKWECPCDEDFWTVPTARSWRNRLGSASQPPCPVFGSLAALLLSAPEVPVKVPSTMLLPNVNTWSANLLMIMAMSEVFHHQETIIVMRAYGELIPERSAIAASSSYEIRRAKQLIGMLEIWKESYVRYSEGRHPDITSSHLQRCSLVIYHLAKLYLVLPVSEIQDCIGRSGLIDAEAALTRLATWLDQHPSEAVRAVEDASACISLIMKNSNESDPYDVIGLFLCHVVLWCFAHAASQDQKLLMVQRLRGNRDISSAILEVIEAGFTRVGIQDGTTLDAPQLIFKHAIQSLVQLGTWGASSNLALLLHLHPGRAG